MAGKTRRHRPLDAALSSALAHPVKSRILFACYEDQASPTELAELLDEEFQGICRYVRGMRDQGLLELVATDSSRGGVQHFYKTAVAPVLDTQEAAEIGELIRGVLCGQAVKLVLDDLRRASEAGSFASHEAVSALREHFTYDDEGLLESGEACMEHLARLKGIQVRSLERLAGSNENGTRVATATLAYPIPVDQ
jgi:hypothetical protein